MVQNNIDCVHNYTYIKKKHIKEYVQVFNNFLKPTLQQSVLSQHKEICFVLVQSFLWTPAVMTCDGPLDEPRLILLWQYYQKFLEPRFKPKCKVLFICIYIYIYPYLIFFFCPFFYRTYKCLKICSQSLRTLFYLNLFNWRILWILYNNFFFSIVVIYTKFLTYYLQLVFHSLNASNTATIIHGREQTGSWGSLFKTLLCISNTDSVSWQVVPLWLLKKVTDKNFLQES